MININKSGPNTVDAVIVGRIDENFDYSVMIETSEPLIGIDLEGVSLINSCGVRELVFLFSKLAERTVILRRIPKIIVDQINMIEGLTGKNIRIESFFAPYIDPISSRQSDILLTPAEVKQGKAPNKIDPITKAELQFDDVEEIYFRFLEDLK